MADDLRTAKLTWAQARPLYDRLSIYHPDIYPTSPFDVADNEGGNPWRYGMAGTPEQIDLDLETKSGGPWAAWVVTPNRALHVAFTNEAPLDRILYFITRRVDCFLRFDRSSVDLTVAAAQAGLSMQGQIGRFVYWSHHTAIIFA